MKEWQPYFIALLIGLLVGIERERAHPKDKALGLRTMILVSLLGALAKGLDTTWIAVVISSFCLSLVVLSYMATIKSAASTQDRGLTTEFAAGILFFLGYAAHDYPTLSAMMGPFLALVLFSKRQLHDFTHAIRPQELQAALLLLLVGVVITNLVPNRAIDPLEIFNPRKFGYIALTLGILEFSGYLLMKFLGEKRGNFLTGFLGGLVSSTAVILSTAQGAKQRPKSWAVYVLSALAATIASLAALLLVIGLISLEVLGRVWIPILGAMGVAIAGMMILSRSKDIASSELRLKSPLDWIGVLKLSSVLGASLAVVALVQRLLGEVAIYATSFVAGLVELQAICIAHATIFEAGKINLDLAEKGVLIAVLASFLSKIAISIFVNRGAYTRFAASIFLLMGAATALLSFVGGK